MTENIEDEFTKRNREIAHIGDIFDEAVNLQNSISNLMDLDQYSLQRIEELQEELISEIHDLAPERANNLRTMIHILNFNHHVCLIQVSNRTRALVFSEFLRRVTEILAHYK